MDDQDKIVAEKLKQADGLARQGDLESSVQTLQLILKKAPDQVQALTMLSRVFRARGDFGNAVPLLKKLSELSPNEYWTLYDLGETLESQGDFNRAASAYLKAWSLNRKNARFALSAGYALWRDGQTQQALNVWSLGSDMDPLVRTAQLNPRADEATRMKSRMADTELRRHFTKMYSAGLVQHGNPARLVSAVWPQTHFGPVEYKVENQKPFLFYAPDLPPLPVFDTSKLAWADTLKIATPDIVNELSNYLADTNDYGRPYLEHISKEDENWRDLHDSEDWNALHLFKDAKEQSCLKAFPKTMAALGDVPMVQVFGAPMEVFFSVLRPGTHIPPHFGLSNSRLTAHLPLIIPKGCEIRVAAHVHKWRVGELFLFDDSYDHEARNDSQDTRIVLIFETWRPDLSTVEISAIQESMENRTTWLNNRNVPEF